MKQLDVIDLRRALLDHPLIDSEDLPCGMVDDVLVEPDANGELHVSALLVGPGAWGPRLPALGAFLVRVLIGSKIVRVPRDQIGDIGEQIRLKSRASVLGLGIGDRKMGLRIGKLPGSERASK